MAREVASRDLWLSSRALERRACPALSRTLDATADSDIRRGLHNWNNSLRSQRLIGPREVGDADSKRGSRLARTP